MRPLLNGTIFALPLPDGTYLPGRVLLDVKGCARRKLLPENSALNFFFGCSLVEMYSVPTKQPELAPSPVLISGALIIAKEIGKTWPVIGHAEVDPKKVEFPELLGSRNHSDGDGAFYCGEISVLLNLPRQIRDDRHCFGAIGLGDSWSYTCHNLLLASLGIPSSRPWLRYGENDLRFSPLREEIYRHLPFPMDLPHYDKQKLMGLDLDRLYDPPLAPAKKSPVTRSKPKGLSLKYECGNFDPNPVQHFLAETFVQPLLKDLHSMMESPEVVQACDADADTLIASIDLLVMLTKHANITPPESDEIEDWQATYMEQWDATAPEVFAVTRGKAHQDLLNRRRKVILDTFKRFIALSKKYHEER